MNTRDDARSLEEARRKLESIRQAVRAQDAALLAAHAQLDPGKPAAASAALRERFEELCRVPDRRGAAGASDVNDWSAIRG